MNRKLNTTIQSLRESNTVALADKAREMVRSGKRVYMLQTGDPDFPTPEPIIQAGYKALKDGYTHYSDSRGLYELRESIAKKLLDETGVRYSHDNEILITAGAVHGLFCVLSAIINTGDEVLVSNPSWMTYSNIIKMLGGVPKLVPSYEENNFFPSIEDLKKQITDKTVALILNSPNNPTGAVADLYYLQQIKNLSEDYNLYVISDEVYEKIVFNNLKHISFVSLPDIKERAIVLNSFSKTYAMTGWRIGYVVANPSIIEQALKVSQNTITNIAPFIQKAALFALTNDEINPYLEKMLSEYYYRYQLATQIIKRCPELQTFKPQGTFYLYIKIKNMNIDSLKFSHILLNDYGVSLVPGSVYGNQGNQYIRVSLTASMETIEKASHLIVECAERIFNNGK